MVFGKVRAGREPGSCAGSTITIWICRLSRPTGTTTWRVPNYASFQRMIENPISVAQYAYGMTATTPDYSADDRQSAISGARRVNGSR